MDGVWNGLLFVIIFFHWHLFKIVSIVIIEQFLKFHESHGVKNDPKNWLFIWSLLLEQKLVKTPKLKVKWYFFRWFSNTVNDADCRVRLKTLLHLVHLKSIKIMHYKVFVLFPVHQWSRLKKMHNCILHQVWKNVSL